jgi:putative aldouronate transport system permease protein
MVSIFTILPLVFVVIISFSAETSIVSKGYSFMPSEWSLDAYRYLLGSMNYIGRSFLLSIAITVLGTMLSLWLIGTMAFVLSQSGFCFRKLYTILIIIPMFFGGGLVASYVVNTQLLGLKNNLFALILPQACSSWYILVMRTYFRENIASELIDAAKIDGAGVFRIFMEMVIPLSKPIFTTIGLFEGLGYWNSWYYAMIYIRPEHKELYPLQYVLYSIQKNAEFMTTNDNISGAIVARIPTETFRMAVVVIITIPVIIAYPMINKRFAKGMMIGAIK